MGKLSSLASDTVIYGVSTILSRLIGWLMMPLYIRVVSQGVYGTFSYIYSWIAILLVVVTLGFETGYFRFASDFNKDRLLGSLSRAVLLFGLFLLIFGSLFNNLFCFLLDFDFGGSSKIFLILMFGIVLFDSYNAIFFAELRYLRLSLRYALLRLFQVSAIVGFTCFFLFYLRYQDGFWGSIDDISYMLLANLLAIILTTIYFLPRIISVFFLCDLSVLRNAIIYSLPLVGMGFFGQANSNIEKILIKHLDPNPDPLIQLGIYSACYKIGVVMSIFTQSFRMAFDPFLFKENKEKEKSEVYGVALKYFVYFGLFIFAGVVLFMPMIDIFLTAEYRQGYVIIPWILIGQLFFGVYYSLSIWFKVTDRTYWGIIMSFFGLFVNTLLNVILIPRFGFIGAAVSTFFGYLTMMILSFLLGKHYYPIEYPVRRILLVSSFVILFVFGINILNDYFLGSFWPILSSLALLLILFILARIENINLGYIKKRLFCRQ